MKVGEELEFWREHVRQGGEGSTQVVQLLYGALHRFTSATTDAISSPPSHSIFHHGIRGRSGTAKAVLRWSRVRSRNLPKFKNQLLSYPYPTSQAKRTMAF